MQFIRYRFLMPLVCILQPAFAQAILESPIKSVSKHDFVNYFGFKETRCTPGVCGLKDHHYYSASSTSSLLLSADSKGRIQHMKLGVPRPLLDDPKMTIKGRDLVKSFVLANMLKEDEKELKALSDEIFIRGLDLQPIKEKNAQFAGGKSPGQKLKAYKVGKGNLNSGDNAIFLEKLPDLPKQVSPLFEVVIGKSDSLGRVYNKVRLAFINDDIKAAKSAIQMLWCESWDERFFLEESERSKSKNEARDKKSSG